MKTKDLVLMALLVGIGLILNLIMPGLFFGMKPDMLLTMMFLGIIIFPDKKHVLILSIVTGLIAAFTTTFPGGQIPNIIDKLVTGFVILGMFYLLKRKKNVLVVIILTIVGTIVSGSVFLYSALLIVGLPIGFLALFLTVVLPTTLINTIFMIIVFSIFTKTLHKFV